MLQNIKTRYKEDLDLATHIFLYIQNKEAFGNEVEKFDLNALKTYVVLVTCFEQQQHEIPSDLLKLIEPLQFFQQLNASNQLLQSENPLSKYLVDAFEVMTAATKCIDDEGFYDNCHMFLRSALQSEQEDVISVYLQIFHRLDRVFEATMPVSILKTIVEAVHTSINDAKLLNEALLLVESNIQKIHKLDAESPASKQMLNFMWHNLCSLGFAKHQCKVCYTIQSQLIKIYLSECQLNETFRDEFLCDDLWHFIRVAIESKETTRRKQAIYILQNVLELYQGKVMGVEEAKVECDPELDIDIDIIWKSYFTVLESLLEIQCHLIISCLDQYLSGIVKYLPQFWYSIIFVLVLRHHNNIVIHYGIEFILSHGISFQHDNNLMNGFYVAINNTYLHSEAKISEQHLAKYFQESDMNYTLKIIMWINWQPVPLWTMVKSLDVYVQLNKGMGFQAGLLLDFLKHAARIIRNMPEVDDIIVNVLENIGDYNLELEQVLGLYDVIGRKEIFDCYKQPLDLQKFELKFILLNQISIETKVKYFQHAIPNVKEQSKFLDQFYEQNRCGISYFPHYEYLMANCLCIEKTLGGALLVILPRIYNLMKPNNTITLDSLSFAVSLLNFIVVKFIDDCHDAATFDTIHKIVVNFHEVIRKKLYADNEQPAKIQQIKEHLTMIHLKMSKCIKLYPSKLQVLGILADAMMLENETIDLSRFDPENENDVKAIQGLYDCFIDRSYELKHSHQANVISVLLGHFHQLELDIWKAYKILLAGKADVGCIFEQTHPYCVEQIDGILVDALIYGNELKGEEKQAYDFISQKSRSMPYNQKVRLSAMRAIAAKQQIEQIRNLKNLLFTKNGEIYRVRYYTNSHHHSLKLRITQAFAFLFRLDPKWDDRMLKMILEEANQTNVTHMNELIIAETIDPATILQTITNIDGNKGLQSLFLTVYYVCCKNPTNIAFIKECIEFLIKYIFVKQIIVRTSAQIVLIKLCERFDLVEEFKVLYGSTKMAHAVKLSRALKFSYAYKYRFNQIDANNLLHTMYILREIPRITKMYSDEYYKHEIYDPVDESLVIHVDDDDNLTSQESVEVELGFIDNAEDTIINGCGGGNVQRKLVTYRETFVDRQILNSLSEEFQRRDTKNDSDLIILGSLLTKAANLGGLSRSGEVFGVKAIALDNLKHLKHSDFTSISMASEKWIKFFEVKHYNVVSYLIAMKSNGYAIIGAEQTAFGSELHKTCLPKKMVLVLGQEKDGIPANVLNLLDMAIEVPQFGVVRSLNVHVTASLFMWEYCKQHVIADLNITR